MSQEPPATRSLLRELLLSPEEPQIDEEPERKRRRSNAPVEYFPRKSMYSGLPPPFLYNHQGHRYLLQPRINFNLHPSNLPPRRVNNVNENNVGQEEQDLMNRLREARLNPHPFYDRSHMVPYPAPQQPHHRHHPHHHHHHHHRHSFRVENEPPQPRDDDLPVTEEMIQHHNQKVAAAAQRRQQNVNSVELPN